MLMVPSLPLSMGPLPEYWPFLMLNLILARGYPLAVSSALFSPGVCSSKDTFLNGRCGLPFPASSSIMREYLMWSVFAGWRMGRTGHTVCTVWEQKREWASKMSMSPFKGYGFYDVQSEMNHLFEGMTDSLVRRQSNRYRAQVTE